MRSIFDYKIIYVHGLEIAPDDGDLDEASIQNILRERSRIYNGLGMEGWELIAEHQNNATLSAVATFKFRTSVTADAHPASASDTGQAGKATEQDPARPDPSYPILQPNAQAPDSYHLVWER